MAVEVDFGSATETFMLHMPTSDLATKVPNVQIQAASTVNPNSRYGLELYNAWVSEFDTVCSEIISTNYKTSQQQITDYLSQPSTGIPTAIVIGGYNGSDHNQFYDSFTCNRPNSVVIKSASSVKDLISQIVVSLCGKQPHYCDHDISRLSAISGRILVIVPQFEMVGHGILSKCVQMFGASGLDFGLVFGVATTVEVLHQQLVKASCCLLDTKTFKLVDSKTIIDQIITHTLLITSVPFQKAGSNTDHKSNQDTVMGKLKLGRTVFRTIMTKFLSYDHSVQNFCSGVKYAIMSMLYETPLACFLDPKLILENVSSQTFEMVRMLPSFQTFIESSLKNNVKEDKRNALAVLEHDSCLFEFVKTQLQQIYAQDLLSATVFNAVLKLQELFSNQSCKKPVYYIYNLVLSANIGDSDYVQNSILLLRKLNLTNIKQLCEYTINLLTELKDIQLENIEIEKQVQELNEFVMELSDEISLDSSDYDTHDEQVYISHSLQQLTSTQRRVTKVSKNADTLFLDDQKPVWHRLVARISHYFSRLFRCCVNYNYITLNEIVYFNDTNSVVKRCLEAEPQQLLNLALKTPSSYLNCNECATISPHSIDISILYNLYLECSRMINLRDLYEAFKSVLNTSVDDPMIQ